MNMKENKKAVNRKRKALGRLVQSIFQKRPKRDSQPFIGTLSNEKKGSHRSMTASVYANQRNEQNECPIFQTRRKVYEN